MISSLRANNRSHDCSDVEVRPSRHLLHHCIYSKFISVCFHSLLHRPSSSINYWLLLVSIVIGLDQKPSSIGEFIRGMDAIGLSLNHNPFIILNTRKNVINWCTDFGFH